MLRWLFLLLLLANALLFFWYAQQQAARAEPEAVNVGSLRLLSELNGDEVLPARERVCLSYRPLSDEYDARRLLRLLADEPVSAEAVELEPAIAGYRLTLPLPAEAAARIELLDELARQGWVPESRGAQLSFGSFADMAALQEVRAALPQPLRGRTQVAPVRAEKALWAVRVKHLSGYEISSEINQLIKTSWPGINIEKNPCEGVASPEVDQ